jgi:glutamate synthase domain-containing protein 3
MVTATRLTAVGTEPGMPVDAELRTLLERHVSATGSVRASELLADWRVARAQFWRVAPKEAGSVEHAAAAGQPYAVTVPSSAAT